MQIRSMGLFILPALVATIALVLWQQKQSLKSSIPKILALGIIPLIINGAIRPTNPANKLLACHCALLNLSFLELCKYDSMKVICEADRDKMLRVNSDFDFQHQVDLQFFPQSPFLQPGITENLCSHFRNTFFEILSTDPLELISGYIKLYWAQFGSWKVSERGNPTTLDENTIRYSESLDKLLSFLNQLFKLIPLLLLLSFYFLRKVPRAILFLWFAAIFHAAGLTAINGLLALRYQSIHQGLLITFLILAWKASKKPISR
jgi:hypothetical protein